LQIAGQAQPWRDCEVVKRLHPALTPSVHAQRGQTGKQRFRERIVKETNAPAVVLAALEEIVSGKACEDAPFDWAWVAIRHVYKREEPPRDIRILFTFKKVLLDRACHQFWRVILT